MIIGVFRYDNQQDTYAGSIVTLTFERNSIVVRPVSKSGEAGPDYRVTRETEGNTFEFGAAWKRTSEKGQDFLSVVLDDPALSRPINAALFRDISYQTARLVWTRPRARPAQPEPATGEPPPPRPEAKPPRAAQRRKPQNG